MFKATVKILKKWKPLKRYKKETDSYSDLRDFIDQEINKKKRVPISVKSKNNLAKTDISVGGDKVAIEVKLNLDRRGKMRYLDSEIRTQSKAYNEGMIILLLGKTNPSDLHDVQDGIKDVRKNLNRGRVYKFPIKIIETPLTELRKLPAKKKVAKSSVKKTVKRKRVARKKRKTSDDIFGFGIDLGF